MTSTRAAGRYVGRYLHILAAAWALAPSSAGAQGLRALIVGGGPTPQDNQVAIESNVRYVLKLLPAACSRTVLFANGDPKANTVLYEKRIKNLPVAERIMTLILTGRAKQYRSVLQFRHSSLSRLDGAAQKAALVSALGRLCEPTSEQGPVLLYFTGHGSIPKSKNMENNEFDLWGESISVRELAPHLAAMPPDQPLTLVMVQCHAGAFGNLLFRDGDPAAETIDHDIAGFFATIKERPAAGCTPEVDEREYHDFTSYFFAALAGVDRVGRPVTGADYNNDGSVGMDEAFCYTLSHDISIDIPTCTSDIYLRKFVHASEQEALGVPYSRILEWATLAQRAALEELSRSLALNGEDRVARVFAKVSQTGGLGPETLTASLVAKLQNFQGALEEARTALYARWPDLKDPRMPGHIAARSEALEAVRRSPDEPRYQALLAAERDLLAAQQEEYKRQLTDARQVRFVRLGKSVVLAHMLRAGSNEAAKRRFEKLVAAEGRTPLPRAEETARLR